MKTVENGMAKELRFSPQTAPDYFDRLDVASAAGSRSKTGRSDAMSCVVSSSVRLIAWSSSLRRFTPCASARSSKVIRAISREPHTDGVEERSRMHRPIPFL